jgi:hypothetical protein
MFETHDGGYEEGVIAGYNEAVAIAINLIQGDPRVDPIVGQDLINYLLSTKR